MTLTQQVFYQARLMAQELTEENQTMLEAMCQVSVSALKARLRENLEPEDCLADFVTAAAMYALAAMSCVTEMGQLEQVTAGDVTMRRSTNVAAACLQSQAEALMAPYLKSRFVFRGV